MVDKVQLHGLEGVRRALRRLPKEIARRELNKALQPAAKLIKDAAIARAPSSGDDFTRKLRGKTWSKDVFNLKDSIAIRNEKKKFLFDTAKKRIGVLSNRRDPNDGAWYWRFVEFGTSKQRAQPFLIPAFEENKFIANKLIQRALLKGVERQARRVRSRA